MTLLARDVMQVGFLTIPSRLPVLEALHLFVKSGVSGALVVAEDGSILGQLRTRDLLGVLDQTLDEDLDTDEPVDVEPELSSLVAEDLATRDIVWAAADATVGELAAILRRPGVDCVVVGTRGAATGVVTAVELLAAVS